jgi:hypothetical protein
MNSFAHVKRAVLRAGELARQADLTSPHSRETTSYGVPATFFKAPADEKNEDTPAWNDALAKFHTASAKKNAQNLLGRKGRQSFPKWQQRLAFKVNAGARDFFSVSRLAYLPAGVRAACGAVPCGYSEVEGRHGCLRADMIVVDSLQRFHTAHADEAFLLHMLYIVARGLPVTTATCALKVQGHVRSLPRADVIEHAQLKLQKIEFLFENNFRRRHPEVLEAMSNCGGLAGSRWQIVGRFGDPRPAASGAEGSRRIGQLRVADLASFWDWLKSHRVVVNSKHARFFWRGEQPGQM